MDPQTGDRSASSAIVMIPNAISLARILLIPVFFGLIVHEGTEATGILLFAAVAATDWVDGYIARRTDTVSELGKLLDPTADRLVIAAGLIALVAAGAFPLWAALLVLVRDAAILLAGLALLVARGGRIDVRFIGKIGTFVLMMAVGGIGWSHFDVPLAAAAGALGWMSFAVGIVDYYAATVLYIGDLRRAFAEPAKRREGGRDGVP